MFAKILPKIAVVLMAIGLIASSNVRGGFGHYGHVSHGFHAYHGHYPYYRSHGYYSYYAYAHPPDYDRGPNDMGAVDLNVKPKSTQVYLNGQYIGRTDIYQVEEPHS